MYINREAESALEMLRTQFKVVIVTGARQVGKTTMLQHTLASTFHYASLDDTRLRAQAQTNPALFFTDHQPPIIIDEVQKAPEIFDEVKLVADQSQRRGDLVLTSSQTYRLISGATESLAGRAAVLELPPLSVREIAAVPARRPFVPRREDPNSLHPSIDLWELIWRGTMPALHEENLDWELFYSNYLTLYIERDVRELISLGSHESFYRFLVACAARTGNIVNMTDIARDAGINIKTAKNWLSILQASGIIRLLRPYHANPTKRVIKNPKLFFMDTGLVCYLVGWTNPQVARGGAMGEALFETFVVSEVLKSYMNAGKRTDNIFYYRDQRKREIDMVIRDGQMLHPIEIKTAATVRSEAIRHFSVLDDIPGMTVGEGAVICRTDAPYSLCENVQAIPVTAI